MYSMPNGKRCEELGQERGTTLQSVCYEQVKASSNCMPNDKDSFKENKISKILININKPRQIACPMIRIALRRIKLVRY